MQGTFTYTGFPAGRYTNRVSAVAAEAEDRVEDRTGIGADLGGEWMASRARRDAGLDLMVGKLTYWCAASSGSVAGGGEATRGVLLRPR